MSSARSGSTTATDYISAAEIEESISAIAATAGRLLTPSEISSATAIVGAIALELNHPNQRSAGETNAILQHARDDLNSFRDSSAAGAEFYGRLSAHRNASFGSQDQNAAPCSIGNIATSFMVMHLDGGITFQADTCTNAFRQWLHTKITADAAPAVTPPPAPRGGIFSLFGAHPTPADTSLNEAKTARDQIALEAAAEDKKQQTAQILADNIAGRRALDRQKDQRLEAERRALKENERQTILDKDEEDARRAQDEADELAFQEKRRQIAAARSTNLRALGNSNSQPITIEDSPPNAAPTTAPLPAAIPAPAGTGIRNWRAV